MSTGVPASIVESLAAVLSPSATGDALALPCCEPALTTRQYLTQCDLATLAIEVVTDDENAKAPYVLLLPGRQMEREDEMDVVCGVRPFMDAGAGQGLEVTSGKIERKPARVKVTATYAAQCGLPGHPAIRVEPQGGDVRICQPQVVAGNVVTFEAFRLPTNVERSMAFVKGGPVTTVARMLWDSVDGDDAGSVLVRSDSCGLRLAGAPIGGLSARIRLLSEEEVSVTLKLPPLGARGKSREVKTGSSSGELQVKSERDAHGKEHFKREDDESGTSRETKVRNQLGSLAVERTTTVEKTNGELKGTKKSDLSFFAGFDLVFTRNGQTVGREAVKDFLETVDMLWEAVDRFQALWAAGPGVKVAVGWSASWDLSFLQISASYKGFRKVGRGGARLHKHHEVSAMVTAVAGSASAGFGLLVEVQRLGVKLLALDYRVTLTLAGKVAAGIEWSTDILDGKEKTQGPWSRPIAGEATLTLKATGTAAVCGRTIGCELAVESGLTVEGSLRVAAWPVEKLEVKRKPVVFSARIFIGSTGEPDLVQTHQLWKEVESFLVYPAPAEPAP